MTRLTIPRGFLERVWSSVSGFRIKAVSILTRLTIPLYIEVKY